MFDVSIITVLVQSMQSIVRNISSQDLSASNIFDNIYSVAVVVAAEAYPGF